MAAQNRRKARAREANQPDLNRKALWIAVVFAGLGLILALYATNLTFQIEGQGVTTSSGCSFNDFVNCDIANASSYARMFGVPVAWWGFLFYAFAAISAAFGLFSSDRRSSSPFVAAAFILAILAVLFTFVKAYHLYDLGVVCIVCVGMYIANFGTAIGLGYGLGVSPLGWPGFIGRYVKGVAGDEAALGFSPNIVKTAIAVLVVFGVGYAGGLDYKKDLTGTSGVDMDDAVSNHFNQPVQDVEAHPEAAVWGNPDAPITIVEWADFQCPACRESAFHLRPALFEYRNDVKLVFMNYPLDIGINPHMQAQLHAQAGNAARASVCAQEYGDFWEYHDDLFRNQSVLAPTLYTRLAEDRGWEPRPFAECMVSEETEQRILRDIELAKQAGVSGTPSIYIQGRKIAYWRNTEFIWDVLDRELANAE